MGWAWVGSVGDDMGCGQGYTGGEDEGKQGEDRGKQERGWKWVKGGSQVCIKMRTTVNTPRLPRYTPPFTSVHTLAGGASVTRRNGVGAMMPRHVVVHRKSRRRARRLLHGSDPRSRWPGTRRWWSWCGTRRWWWWCGARRWWWWCPYGGWWQLRWWPRRGSWRRSPGRWGWGRCWGSCGRLLHRAGRRVARPVGGSGVYGCACRRGGDPRAADRFALGGGPDERGTVGATLRAGRCLRRPSRCHPQAAEVLGLRPGLRSAEIGQRRVGAGRRGHPQADRIGLRPIRGGGRRFPPDRGGGITGRSQRSASGGGAGRGHHRPVRSLDQPGRRPPHPRSPSHAQPGPLRGRQVAHPRRAAGLRQRRRRRDGRRGCPTGRTLPAARVELGSGG